MSAHDPRPTATARSWHPVSLSIQLAVLVLAEIVLFQTYGAHDARFHWAAHFLVALATAALVLLAVLLVRGSPGRYPLLLVLGLHLFAMAPDLIFRAGLRTPSGWTSSSGTSRFTTCRAATPPGS